MKYILTFTVLFFFIDQSEAQIKLSFLKDSITIKKSSKTDVNEIPFKFEQGKNKIENLEVDIVPDYKTTTLNNKKFKINFARTSVSKLSKENSAFLIIKKDSTTFDLRSIALKFQFYIGDSIVNDINLGDNKRLHIDIKPKDEVTGYEYLAYVGTNFDLVEGIRASDLFFAANVYKTPNPIIEPDTNKNGRARFFQKGVGFYLSLYGNRAFTQVDSTSLSISNTSVEAITDTTFQRITTRNRLLSRRTTDNLGAYVSPLFQIRWLNGNNKANKNKDRAVKLYYAPSLEFVYRRTTVTFENTGNTINSTTEVVDGTIDGVQNANIPNALPPSTVFNEYSFNAGAIGLFLSLENKSISVRVHGSVGYSSNYFVDFDARGNSFESFQESDIFFSGRAWITEPKTGLTLQAEVNNSALSPRPLFVATLSKAFNFSKLASIFQPITSR